jgi:hypothetical protein
MSCFANRLFRIVLLLMCCGIVSPACADDTGLSRPQSLDRSGQDTKSSASAGTGKVEGETCYLAFQIFTYFSPDPKVARLLSSGHPEPLLPGRPALRDYIQDIKQRIGTVGTGPTHLAVMLGPLCFEQTDADCAKFVELAFDLALETDVAVGFHLDDSMFWARRKDLWNDLKNVEALDWEGTPCTGRRLDWQTGPGAKPDAAPPQMCFNSPVILREVQQRASLIGKAIQAGVKKLRDRQRAELFAGVIAGWETMIGQDFKTDKYLGYRALLNRGFSREHPPQDLDRERESVVREFIDHWAKALVEAGVAPEKIYSHTAFLSRRAFKIGGNAASNYSQQNHFAPPSVAFGKFHRPGFSTYPQPGLFDDIYEELSQHIQTGWASSEGTNLQLGSGPGQSGMNMETYLAKTFNHGGTLVNIFSWGIGGEAMKNMDFRVVTEGEEALRAYRKFLKGETLIEAKSEGLTLLERLPPKIHKIREGLNDWVQKGGNAEKAMALMQKLDGALKSKKFEEAETIADSLLQLMGAKVPVVAADLPDEVRRQLTHTIGSAYLLVRVKVQAELQLTAEQKAKFEKRLGEHLPETLKFLQTIETLKPEERERALHAYRPKAWRNILALEKDILTEAQQTRLQQLVYQREGLFGDTEALKELGITEAQRQQFVAAIQPVDKKMHLLMEEIQKGAKPDEIRPRVLKLRADLQETLETLLTEAQKKQWREMRGQAVELGVLFDDVSR